MLNFLFQLLSFYSPRLTFLKARKNPWLFSGQGFLYKGTQKDPVSKNYPILKICTLLPCKQDSLYAASTNWLSFSIEDPSLRFLLN